MGATEGRAGDTESGEVRGARIETPGPHERARGGGTLGIHFPETPPVIPSDRV
jgi:hypothetical protein